MSTKVYGKVAAKRSISENGPVRHVLVSVLILFGLIGGYMSWKALFALDPVVSGLYSVLAMVAFWGTWALYRNSKDAETAE
ncbi:MAG: hypothetical protein R3D32_08350 [Nitratireductor sp.]